MSPSLFCLSEVILASIFDPQPDGAPRRRAALGRRAVSSRPGAIAARRGGGGRSVWRALATSGIFKAVPLARAVYHAELARGLRALGYEVRADAGGRELRCSRRNFLTNAGPSGP